MKIKDMDFTILKSCKKRCITFAKNGNTVIKPYKTLYSLESMTEFPNLYVEIVENKESWEADSYHLWEDLGKICISKGYASGCVEIDQFVDNVSKYPYWGKEGYFKILEMTEEKGFHISNLDIEVCVILGEIDLAMHYRQYREDRNKAMEEKRQAEIALRETREREQEEKRLARIEETVAAAENTIRKRKTLRNEKLEDKTIVLYLLKKYGVNVPIKTQGWINNALASVYFLGKRISYTYYNRSKDSKVFYGYLKELEEKVRQNV